MIKYMQYIERGSKVDLAIANSNCPLCGKPMIKGLRLAKSPNMIKEKKVMDREFASKGCVSCLIEFCYDEDETMYFRPVPQLKPRHKS